MPDRMGLILLVENLDQYEAAVKSVKGANDQVASSMGAVEVKSKKADKSFLSLTSAFAVANVAAQAAMRAITAITGSIKRLIVETTMATARYKVMDAALDASADQAGYTKEEMDELQMAIHRKGVTYEAATGLVLQLIDAEMGLEGALDLVTTAQNAASRAGVSSSETVQRMLWAIQTANPILLRSVYLTVDFARAEEELAKSLDTSRDALNDSQRMQARMNAVIKAGEPLLGTYEAAMGEGAKVAGSLRDRVKDIKTVVGEITYPAWSEMIVTAYNKAKKLLAYLEDNRETLEEMGRALAEGVKAAIVQVDALIEKIGEIPGAVEGAGVSLAGLVIGLEEAEERAEHLGETFNQVAGLVAAGWAHDIVWIKAFIVEIGEAVDALLPFRDTILLLQGELTWEEWIRATDDFAERIKIDFAAIGEAADKAYREQMIEAIYGGMDALRDFNVELDRSRRAALAALDDIGDAAVEATEKQIEAAEALANLRLDLQRELADDLIEEERELLQDEIALAREREDLARKNARAIADAYAKAEEERAALTLDTAKERTEYERDAAEEWLDLERDAVKEREDLDRDYADTRVDIEISTRRRLQDIQRQFEMSVQDAARTRDAFALVQAQRRAATEREEALHSRDEQLGDARTAYQRQIRDYKATLAQQREDLKKSLEEQKVELEQSLVEQQQAIEQQLREQLLAIEEANRQEAEERARQMVREQEDVALQARWEQEDRTKRLQRQLEDMKIQYGDLGAVTAEGLQEQVREWADAYGPEGAATRTVKEWAAIMDVELARVMAELDETTEATDKLKRGLEVLTEKTWKIDFEVPPELQLQSPKTALQVGMEKLQDMLKQPMPAFLAGGLPAPAAPPGGRQMPSRVSHDHSGRLGIDVNAPGNLDLVVQRQLAATLKQMLEGVTL